MTVCRQLTFPRESLQGLALPGCVVPSDVIENGWFQNEESAVYPSTVTAWFLTKPRYQVVLQVHSAESAWRLRRRYRRQLAVRFVKRNESREVYVPHAVSIGHTETRIPHVVTNPLESAASCGQVTRIDQRYLPRLREPTVHLERAPLHVNGHV